jgi:hypothetical protein
MITQPLKQTEIAMRLWKTTIVIWTDFNPVTMELGHLARNAEYGDAFCSKQSIEEISDPKSDPDWEPTDFFNSPMDCTCDDGGSAGCPQHDDAAKESVAAKESI